MRGKRLKIFFSLLGVLLIAIAFSSLSFKQRVNDNPLPSFYKKGVYHLHSTFSDGRGGIEAISRAAGKQDLDFVILTDHGRPNRRSSAATRLEPRCTACRRIGILAPCRAPGRGRVPHPQLHLSARTPASDQRGSARRRRDLHRPPAGPLHPLDRLAGARVHRH